MSAVVRVNSKVVAHQGKVHSLRDKQANGKMQYKYLSNTVKSACSLLLLVFAEAFLCSAAY